jgi:hypothetical protein
MGGPLQEEIVLPSFGIAKILSALAYCQLELEVCLVGTIFLGLLVSAPVGAHHEVPAHPPKAISIVGNVSLAPCNCSEMPDVLHLVLPREDVGALCKEGK